MGTPDTEFRYFPVLPVLPDVSGHLIFLIRGGQNKEGCRSGPKDTLFWCIWYFGCQTSDLKSKHCEICQE